MCLCNREPRTSAKTTTSSTTTTPTAIDARSKVVSPSGGNGNVAVVGFSVESLGVFEGGRDCEEGGEILGVGVGGRSMEVGGVSALGSEVFFEDFGTVIVVSTATVVVVSLVCSVVGEGVTVPW